ncbi:MAG TPA: 4-alpha-glucanotransferase [Chlamydiales bacterium]|nr:4-alpha-glucanotransferase [Chlamydiales bacterium]
MTSLDKISQYLQHTAMNKHWNSIGIKHHHGICIPLFSLKTTKSAGIGEYLDLIPLIDFCKEVGMNIIQLLPINETGPDNSPYNAISSCALDPVYISLHQLPLTNTEKEKLSIFEVPSEYERISYMEVKEKKFDFLEAFFESHFHKYENTTQYKNFIANHSWLKPYAVFRILKDLFGQKKWKNWPKTYQNPSESLLNEVSKKYPKKINQYIFYQYLCFSQMMEVKEYATNQKIFIKGDIPILISPDSVDLWYYRDQFNQSHTAGCPPDQFNPHGQNWGFPLFNWEEMKTNDYFWWKQRLKVAENFYHLFRIDHAVGLFRIFAILPNETPAQGQFFPLNPFYWMQNGKEKLLMMIHNTSMFPIAEDLGLIPEGVYKILKDLGIPGTKIMRFEISKKGFKPIDEYEQISMTCTGTHDLDTLSEWWMEEKREAKIYCKEKEWHYSPQLTKKQLFSILKSSHKTNSLFHINPFQEYLALIDEYVSDHPEEERINKPGTSLPTNWTYRFRPSIEEFSSNEKFKSYIKKLIS